MFWNKKPAKTGLIPIICHWVPLALGITAMSVLVYAAGQQNYRQSAKDPQIQMAEDAAAKLSSGQTPDEIVGSVKVDLNRSSAPYLIVFDQNGHAVVAGAELDGQTPTPPVGVFENARANSENRLTWQPRAGVRQAIVVRPIGGAGSGFILAGRSLGEVERRESDLQEIVLLAWLGTLAATLVVSIVLAKLRLSD